MSKIIERFVADQLTAFLSSSYKSPSTQSRFREYHSTIDCFVTYTSCLILLDFSKAFDTINHDIVRMKLQYLGLGAMSLIFFTISLIGLKEWLIYFSVAQKHPKIIFDNYEFRMRHMKSSNKTLWICTQDKNKCKVRIQSSGNRLLIKNIAHNHVPTFNVAHPGRGLSGHYIVVTIVGDVDGQPTDNDSETTLEAIVGIKKTLEIMNARLRNIELTINSKFHNPQGGIKNEISKLLPVESLEKLEELELRIQNESDRESLFQVLQYIGGTSEKSCVVRCIEKLLSNQCGMFCSWTGKKGNFKIKDLESVQVVKDAVRISFPQIKDDVFERAIRSWLQFAKLRHDRGKK
ncbi:unnamed protein product [Ceutorhynchus assimilis]|uniref:DUF4806 domain-containing protein n=1 Tax=Ceutorhynchus assimilis TaxID=467358 RepID=A0A9N9MHF3_9CUCU|nr:unnamed protein product [Ceutorhynchus assimilis]